MSDSSSSHQILAIMTPPPSPPHSHLPLQTYEPAAEQISLHEASSTTAPNRSSPIFVPSSPSFSDYGSDLDRRSTRSMSISTSTRTHTFENGRRYHKFREGSYVFPNDESEQDREEMKHAMIVNLCGGRLHFAPVGKYAPQNETSELHNVIDLGTGIGIWCMEMGDEYPSAQILGVDLSPIQPVWVPPNVRFMVDDVESDWLEPENFYDLVHARHVTQAFKDFPSLLRRSYRHLKPGGWIELQEMHHLPHSATSDPLPTSYPLLTFFQLAVSGLAALGTNLDYSLSQAASLSNYGFVNIRHETLQIPIGTWPEDKTLKTVGSYARVGIEDGLEAMTYGPLCRGLGWSKEKVEVFLGEVRGCLRETDGGVDGVGVNAYLPFHVWCGQKPLDAREGTNEESDEGMGINVEAEMDLN